VDKSGREPMKVERSAGHPSGVGHNEERMKPSSDHIESARILLAEVPAALSALQAEYKQCVVNLAVSPKFRVQTQSFLGHLRSILDFLAHDMTRFCSRPPSKVYFPIAKIGITRTDFETNLSNKWLPGLDRNRPDLFDFLVKLQHFYPGNDWLPAFNELSNKNKHVKLSKMEIGGCDAVIIRFHGKPVMQIGARGFESITIRDGGTLLFGADANLAVLRGPQTIDRNTKQLLYADAGLDVITAAWNEFKFDEFPQQPAIVFLEIAEKEVRRISEKIEALA
jgi:hypothetical protein